MPTQHVATLLGATCCVRLATVLRCVATCWVLLAQIWKWSNLSQQHPTCRNTVTKRTQHVAPNNVATCCVGMLRSFGRGLRWLNTVFARAQILHKNKHGINSTIILFQFPRYLFYFCFTNEYNVLMVLLFYYKGMLEKVTMQRTQQFSAFVCYRKNPVKCSACVVSRKNCDWVKNWPLGDTHISREPLIRILRNLAQKYFRR